MKNFSAATLAAIILALAGAAAAAPATPAPMTREQGDAILKELREIKQLLARQQPAQPAPQPPQNLAVKGDAIYVLGKSDAPLTMVEFTDYQCPFCGRFEATTYPLIKKNYIDTGKMRLIVRDLPLPELHPYALKAAQAVHCAADQGKFWEMKDIVFKNQNKLDKDALAGYAKSLGLDGDTYAGCTAGSKHLKEIAEEAKYAQSLGITGTPTFIVGKTAGDTVQGRVIVGALPYENFAAVIDALLAQH
jgi:protein-disulfide isomerase